MECCTNQQGVIEEVVCKIERQIEEIEMVVTDIHNALSLQPYPDLKQFYQSSGERSRILDMRLSGISSGLDDTNKMLGVVLSAVRGQLGSLKLVG